MSSSDDESWPPARRPTTRWAGQSLVHRLETGSTNDDVRSEISRGAPHGFTVVADAQSSGRGRAGRVWHSPRGVNLYTSVLCRIPAETKAPSTRLILGVGLAVADAIAPFVAPHVPALKWPNDVRVNGKKISGVLLEGIVRTSTFDESTTAHSPLRAVVAGIGINVNAEQLPDEIAPIATSIRMETGRRVSRERLLESLLQQLETRFDAWREDASRAVCDEFAARCCTIGTLVRTADLEGVAEALDDDGALWLRTSDGQRVRVLNEIVGVHDTADQLLQREGR